MVFLSFLINMFTAEVHMESLIALLAGKRGFIKIKTTSKRYRAVTRQWSGGMERGDETDQYYSNPAEHH